MSGKDKDPRPFKCSHPGCQWTFSRQEHQSRHLRTHSGERPFSCHYPNCPSKFARNDELKRHIRLIHEYATDTTHEAALADTDQVVYNGHGRRQSEQFTPQSSTYSSSSRRPVDNRYAEAPSGYRESSSSSRSQLPPRPATSMNHHRSASHSGQVPETSRSRYAPQPSPLGTGGSYMPQQNYPHPPPTTMHPPLPLHYRSPTTRPYTPVLLPPLQGDGYATDGGRRERRVQLPGFSEIAGQHRDPDPNRRHY